MIILIAHLITQYKKEALEGSIRLNPDETHFLNELDNNINAFFHIQKNWLAHGLLGKYWQRREGYSTIIPDFNQLDLLEESRKAILDSFKFANIMCEQLYKNTKSGGCYCPVLQSSSYTVFLDKINKLLRESMQFLQTEQDKIEAYSAEKILAGHFYSLASQLNGRYIYSDQRFDPIAFIHSGTCFGHVLSWRDAVVKTGKCIAMARNDATNFNYQLSQHKYSADFYQECQNHLNIWSAIEKLLLKCKTNGIYMWSYVFYYHNKNGHAFGIRKLSGNEIECFDPNLGLFIFPEHTFSLWFTHLLSCYLHDYSLFGLESAYIGEQPPHAAATIPPIKLDKPHAIDCNYFFNVIPHHGILAGFRGDLKEEIRENQKNNLRIARQKIFQLMKEKFRTEIRYRENEDEEDYRKYHFILKNKAVQAIENEINRRRREYFHFNTLTIDSLTELQHRINHAEIELSLKTVVNTLLNDRHSCSNLTYKEILNDNHLEDSFITYNFIYSFVSDYEINPFYMRFLQERIKARIIDIAGIQLTFLGEKNMPDFYKNIIKILCSTLSLEEVLVFMQKHACKPMGLFSFSFDSEDQHNNDFHKILRELQIDHAFFLQKTHHKLKNLSVHMEENMRKQYSPLVITHKP